MRQVHWVYWLPSLVLGCSSGVPEWIPPGNAPSSASETGTNTLQSSQPGGVQTTSNATAATSTTANPAVDGAPPPAFNYDGQPHFSRAVQLTNEQWANSVRDVLKLAEKPTQANSFLRPVGGFTTFINNERVLEVTNDMRDSYRLAAEEIALQVNTESAITKIDAGSDADTFVKTFGRRAFRRPLTADELARYKTLFDKAPALAGDESDFVKGASLVVQAMLQSPNFIYRTELTPDGQRLNGFEIAARLSYWLANTTPSDALLDQAEAGALDTNEGVKSLVTNLLDGDPAVAAHTEMHAELFKFSRYREIVKFTEEYDPETNAELEEASRLFFDRIFTENLGLNDILTSTKGYAGPAMAPLYGKSAPAEMTLMDFGADRPGFFAQVPYLALFGDDTHSDAIHRGLFINFQVLCAKLPKPGDEVALPPAPVAGQQDRERMEKHTGKDTCGEACHGNYINPLGYAFENFDGLGRYRTMDQGRPVDATSAYPFATGLEEFNGASELMTILANSDVAHECYAKNLMSYALQRDIVVDDEPLVKELAAMSKSGSAGLKSLILELAQSPAFLTRQETESL
jgi:Protein of unknown function (DUF1588)/Protein of unknown function (DUF1592)/Protein of unknown function (DUF1595)/Protein of unknown function (DUF1585)/Protein of unknown function (DUF1587)